MVRAPVCSPLVSDTQTGARRINLNAGAADTPLTEKLHVVALDAMVSGRYREAAVVYETILLQDPRDLLALRCSFDLYQILGYDLEDLCVHSRHH